MKKIALLLAVLIALSLFVACSAQEEQDKLPEGSQEITEQPTEQPKEEKYVMYMDSGSNFESEAVVLGNEVTIKAAAYKDFSRSKTTKIDRPENMPETYRSIWTELPTICVTIIRIPRSLQKLRNLLSLVNTANIFRRREKPSFIFP